MIFSRHRREQPGFDSQSRRPYAFVERYRERERAVLRVVDNRQTIGRAPVSREFGRAGYIYNFMLQQLPNRQPVWSFMHLSEKSFAYFR